LVICPFSGLWVSCKVLVDDHKEKDTAHASGLFADTDIKLIIQITVRLPAPSRTTIVGIDTIPTSHGLVPFGTVTGNGPAPRWRDALWKVRDIDKSDFLAYIGNKSI
jgi:hypothetical protein